MTPSFGYELPSQDLDSGPGPRTINLPDRPHSAPTNILVSVLSSLYQEVTSPSPILLCVNCKTSTSFQLEFVHIEFNIRIFSHYNRIRPFIESNPAITE